MTKFLKSILPVLALVVGIHTSHSDTFGTSGNEFTIDFVAVGNAGNADDATGYGGVSYNYRIGLYEIPLDAVSKAISGGLINVTASGWSSNHPATDVTWYEAASFVNWLNTSKGYQTPYNLNYDGRSWTLNLWSPGSAWQIDGQNLYRHKDAYYFLPSEDEWYKAAYHKGNGASANYWLYATGSDNVPDGLDFPGDAAFDAVFWQGYEQGGPNTVDNVGVASPYGTYGQSGNVYEFQESAWDSSNDASSEGRAVRGGYWFLSESGMRSSLRLYDTPAPSASSLGFRVASVVPEPSTYALLALGAGVLMWVRRRR